MSKTGRPLKGDAPRDLPVSCRLTKREWHQLDDLARRRRCSKADLLRIAIVGLLESSKTPAKVEEGGENAGERIDSFLSKYPWH
jgi:hypothetical protein